MPQRIYITENSRGIPNLFSLMDKVIFIKAYAKARETVDIVFSLLSSQFLISCLSLPMVAATVFQDLSHRAMSVAAI